MSEAPRTPIFTRRPDDYKPISLGPVSSNPLSPFRLRVFSLPPSLTNGRTPTAKADADPNTPPATVSNRSAVEDDDDDDEEDDYLRAHGSLRFSTREREAESRRILQQVRNIKSISELRYLFKRVEELEDDERVDRERLRREATGKYLYVAPPTPPTTPEEDAYDADSSFEYDASFEFPIGYDSSDDSLN